MLVKDADNPRPLLLISIHGFFRAKSNPDLQRIASQCTGAGIVATTEIRLIVVSPLRWLDGTKLSYHENFRRSTSEYYSSSSVVKVRVFR